MKKDKGQQKGGWKSFLLNLDQYIAAVLFIVIMVLLFVQVVTRYVFHHSFTWTEELAPILFVWMTYAGVSSAITYRKHIRIDALLNVVPFKVKKGMLIAADFVFIAFDIYLIFPFLELIQSIGSSTTPILHIPKAISYVMIPVVLVISVIKLFMDIRRLIGENEQTLGTTKPTLDLDAMEREYQESQKQAQEQKGEA